MSKLRYITTLTLIVFAAVIFVPENVSAGWNPLKDVTNFVKGGVRAVGSVFGEGLAGLAGPVVSDTSEAIQKVLSKSIDDAQKAAGVVVDQANVAAADRLKQVDGIIGNSIQDADDRVRKQIDHIDEIIVNRLGNVDVIATKQVVGVEKTLISVVKYLSLLALTTVLLGTLFWFIARKWIGQNALVSLSPGIVVTGLLGVIFAALAASAASFFNPPSGDKLLNLEKSFSNSYRSSLVSGDLDSATFFASQLSALNAEKTLPRMLANFASLQRDVLRRPALFQSVDGAREIYIRTGQMADQWEEVENSEGYDGVKYLAYEVPALSAVVGWQRSTTVGNQQAAGCTALKALSNAVTLSKGVPSPGSGASAFMWLSATYVDWLVKTDPDFRNASVIKAKCAEQFASEDGESSIKSAIDFGTKFSSAPEKAPLLIRPVVQYNVASTKYFEAAAPAYFLTVMYDSQYRKETEKAKQVLWFAKREATAQKVLDAWSEYEGVISKVPDLQERDILLASTGLPMGIYTRTVNIKSTLWPEGEAPALPARTSVVYDGANPASCMQSFGHIAQLFSDGIKSTVCLSQKVTDDQLIGFEEAIQSALSQPNTDALSKLLVEKPDFAPLVAAIKTCLSTGEGGYVECAAQEVEAKNRRVANFLYFPGDSNLDKPITGIASWPRLSMVR